MGEKEKLEKKIIIQIGEMKELFSIFHGTGAEPKVRSAMNLLDAVHMGSNYIGGKRVSKEFLHLTEAVITIRNKILADQKTASYNPKLEMFLERANELEKSVRKYIDLRSKRPKRMGRVKRGSFIQPEKLNQKRKPGSSVRRPRTTRRR